MIVDNKALWSSNRRKFLKGMIAAGILTKVGFLESCVNSSNKNLLENSFFSVQEMQNLTAIVNRLFPDDGNGPNVDDINVIPHILWTLQDNKYGFDAFEMFQTSVKQLSDFTAEYFATSFSELPTLKQDETIVSISQLKWGDRFLSNTLNYIFEALAIDPAYNVNTNKVGWKWLQHQSGQPQPLKTQLYPEFLKRYNNEV